MEASQEMHRPPSAFASNKLRIGVVAVVLALALGYLIYAAFPGNTLYYLTLEEFLSSPVQAEGKEVRVFGKLQPDSFQRVAGSTTVTFTLTDGQRTLPARYEGVVPDLFFNPDSEIVLQGRYGTDGVFQANDIIVKCPSKFQEMAADGQG